MKRILENGTSYKYNKGDLSESIWKLDLEAALSQGNHKSAKVKEKVLEKAFVKEVKLGYQLPLKPHHISDIPSVTVSLMGVADQLSIHELWEIIEKDRVT